MSNYQALRARKIAYVGGRISGKRALAEKMARDCAADMIARGANPKAFISFAGPHGVKTVTLESLIAGQS